MNTLFYTWRLYLGSPKYRRLSQKTCDLYANGFRTLHEYGLGDMPVQHITRSHVIKFRDDLYDTPGKLKIALAVLSNILQYAYDRGDIEYNHAKNVGDLPPTKPIPRWDESEIDLFLSTAKPYLQDAVILALYTGQRVSDLVKITWDDYEGRTIKVKQKKTGKTITIPAHYKLRMRLLEIRNRNRKQTFAPYILLNSYYQKWPTGSLIEAIIRHNNKIGLRGKSIHGLRKSAASILAESGCTPAQIMAITGHQTLKEVTRYTAEVDQVRLAVEAISKWENNDGNEGDPARP